MKLTINLVLNRCWGSRRVSPVWVQARKTTKTPAPETQKTTQDQIGWILTTARRTS